MEVAFGPFRLDSARQALTRGGAPVPLAPKEFAVLHTLVSRAGRDVTKDDLVATVWDDAPITDANIAQHVCTVRRALDDDPRGHRYILTVPRRGYRFVASVRPVVPIFDGARRRVDAPITDDALELYCRGQALLAKRKERDLRDALAAFEAAAQRAPEYALAHVGIADACGLLGQYLIVPATQTFGRAKLAALRAIAIDRRCAAAHASLADVLMFFDREWDTMLRTYEHAIELDGGLTVARRSLAWYHLLRGDFDAAREELDIAAAIDSATPLLGVSLGMVAYFRGDDESAISHLSRELTIDPNSPMARYFYAAVLAHAGRYTDALAALDGIEAAFPALVVAQRGAIHAAAGRRTHARNALRQLDSLASQGYVSAFAYAMIHAALGDDESALDALARAADERAAWTIFAERDPQFAHLREHRGFAELRPRLGLPF